MTDVAAGELPAWDVTDCPGISAARVVEAAPAPQVLQRSAQVHQQVRPA